MNEIKIFEEEQQWYFSVVDVCDALAESTAKKCVSSYYLQGY